jgi:cytoskeletal protein CcmA (bactofilin family)
MPTIVFLFVYLSHLLRIGEEETADEVVSEVLSDDGSDSDPVLIPRNGSVSDDAWRVSTPATVGDDCRLHGNLRAERLAVGEDNIVFGSLRAKSDVHVGEGTEIKGDVTTRDGTVSVGPDVTIWGDISATDVQLHEDATVEGSIRARGEMTMLQSDSGTGAPEEDATDTDDSDTDESDGGDAVTDDETADLDAAEVHDGWANSGFQPSDDGAAADDTGESTDDTADESDDSEADDERVTASDAESERVTDRDPDDERVTVTEDGSDTDDDYRENGHEAGLAE